MTNPKTRLKIPLCHNCRSKKVRCDLKSPCKNCEKTSVECVRPYNDRRKERYLNEYVESLQDKVKALEMIITNANVTSDVINHLDKKTFDSSSSIIDHQSPGPESISSPNGTSLSMMKDERKSFSNEKYPYPSNFKNLDKHDNLSVYGPISVFDNELVNKSSSGNGGQDIRNLNQDPDIINCIKLFFVWQYPDHNIFLFREAFLIDFFNPKAESSYCSVQLVYSICALGSRMSDDENIYNRSSGFYKKAKNLLLNKLDEPSITSMQSFLLLSFYDICNGNNSSGWMLSGNGIRMGFDLGFQLDPKTWFLKSNEKISSLNIAIRSRIFWGCYLADHFISLLLGRPSILKMSDTSIPETDDLPDLDWIEEYSYDKPRINGDENTIVYISSPLKSLIKLINISSDMLNDVFTRDQDATYELALKFDKLNYFNTKILEWKTTLPPSLQWNQTLLIQKADNPTFMNSRYYYYILLLCLNRPFIEITKQNNFNKTMKLSPSTICNEVIDDIVISIGRFKQVHGLKKASVFIVYCSILSVSVLLLSKKVQSVHGGLKKKLSFFMTILYGCSKTWKLAEKSFKLIEQKLEKDHEVNLTIFNDEVVAKSCQNVTTPQDNTDAANNTEALIESTTNPDDLALLEDFEFFGGPPLLMTSDLFNQDWEFLFPDYPFGNNNLKDSR